MPERHILVNALAAKAGGLRNFMVNLVRELQRAPGEGHRYTFLLPDETARSLPGQDDRVRVVPHTRLPNLPLARAAWEQTVLPLVARRQRADLLVSASSFGPRFPGTRHLVWLRNDLYFSPEYAALVADDPRESRRIAQSRTLLRASLAGADTVAVLQEGMIERVRAIAEVPRRKFVVIPNACPTPSGEVRSAVRDLRADHPDRHIINGVQYFHRYRNFEAMTAALRQLKAAGMKDALLVLAVDPNEEPPYSQRFMDSLNAPELEGLTLNLGHASLAEVYELYRQSDVAVFPSLSEAFSVAYLMAMASDTPVVASDFPFARALCGDAALYFPHDRPDVLADHITRLRKDHELRAELVKRGSGSTSRYTWTRTRQAFLDAIDLTIERSSDE